MVYRLTLILNTVSRVSASLFSKEITFANSLYISKVQLHIGFPKASDTSDKHANGPTNRVKLSIKILYYSLCAVHKTIIRNLQQAHFLHA